LLPPPLHGTDFRADVLVRGGLDAKYGKPIQDEAQPVAGRPNPNTKTSWLTPEGETLLIFRVKPLPDGTRTSVGVQYGKWDPRDLNTKGL
jgi:hypothetical protein